MGVEVPNEESSDELNKLFSLVSFLSPLPIDVASDGNSTSSSVCLQ